MVSDLKALADQAGIKRPSIPVDFFRRIPSGALPRLRQWVDESLRPYRDQLVQLESHAAKCASIISSSDQLSEELSSLDDDIRATRRARRRFERDYCLAQSKCILGHRSNVTEIGFMAIHDDLERARFQAAEQADRERRLCKRSSDCFRRYRAETLELEKLRVDDFALRRRVERDMLTLRAQVDAIYRRIFG